jgi:hypothetical protein
MLKVYILNLDRAFLDPRVLKSQQCAEEKT